MSFLFEKEITIRDLEKGDLIEFYRAMGTYSHWAVYVGHGKVIHLSPNPDATGKLDLKNTKRGTGVRKDDIKTVAGNSKVYRKNEFDDEIKPFSKSEIVKRATNRLGTHGYNVVTYNCEHFATECRYGEPRSKQAEAVADRTMTGIWGAALLLRLQQSAYHSAIYQDSWSKFFEKILRNTFDKLFRSQSGERVKL